MRVKIKVIAVMVRLGRVVRTTLIVARRYPIGLV
jgi:hypothetical protein